MNKGTLIISKYRISDVLIAESEFEQMMGLMHREAPLPPMCFIYRNASINKFWMKNTKQALAIIYSHDNRIVQICKGEPYSTSLIGQDILSDLIVEIPWDTFESSQIKIGDHIKLITERL
jgi:uncharacterized membrane protein (UPF0127 family)